MSTKETITPLNLRDQNYFFEFTTSQNPYLGIGGLDDIVSSGRYSFYINGSEYLKKDSIIRFEAIDSEGNLIFISGIRNLLRGTARVVSFEVNDNIKNGIAKIYVSAVLDTYDDRGEEVSVPNDFLDTENILLTHTFQIDKTRVNTDEIIFRRPPQLTIEPLLKTVRQIDKPSRVSTTITADIIDYEYDNEKSIYTLKTLSKSNNIELDMDGASVTFIDTPITINGGIINVPGSPRRANLIIPNPDLEKYSQKDFKNLLQTPIKFSVIYNDFPKYNLQRQQQSAFADITITDMETVSGDVEKIKIFAKSDTLQTDYNLLSEYDVIGKNLLNLEAIGDIGIFDDNDKLNSWSVSKIDSGASNPTIAIDNTRLLSAVTVQGDYDSPQTKEVNGKLLQKPRYKLESDTSLSFYKNIQYKIKLNAALINAPSVKDTRCDVYIQGTGLDGDVNQYGKLLGSLRSNKNYIWENEFETTFTNSSDVTDGKIIFVITSGQWILQKIQIESELQQGFSPQEFRVQVPVDVKKDQQDMDFIVEFFDANNNKSDFILRRNNIIFDRPNLVIEGFDNFLSGSLFVGEATSSGIGLGKSDAGGAFIKSIPYFGFTDATTGGFPGFMLYSGSVTSSIENEYTGALGFEVVKDEDNLFRFRLDSSQSIDTVLEVTESFTSSIFEVKTDNFFFGNADTQFVSGSNNNIEISASNFHLDPKNNLLILRGAIRQDSNGVELNDFRNRGTWQVGNIYLNNDIVQYGFNDVTQSYIAVNDHTASAVDPDGPPEPDASNNWEVFASGGTPGADGADGSDGIDSFAVNLIASDQSIEYDETGANPSPPSVGITASAVNTEGIIYYEFFLNDSSQQNTTSNTFALTPEASIDDMPQKIEVQIRSGSVSSGILARDQVTVFGIQDGADAYTVILTNEAHTLPTTNTGTVTYTGSGTSVIVYKGTSELNGITSGTPTTGQFSATVSATNITAGSQTSTGNPIVFADASNMTADNASIEFTINAEGVASITKIQSFAKSIQGDNGPSGSAGVPGPGVVFRGEYDDSGATTYFASNTRRDVVEGSNGQYYLCIDGHAGSADKAPITGGSYTSYWESFGATFSSVATDILFAQDVYANRTINVGSSGSTPLIALDSDFGNSGANPSIKINSSGYNTNGIFLGYDSSTAKLSLKSGTNSLFWDGTNLNITGNINATGTSTSDAFQYNRVVIDSSNSGSYLRPYSSASNSFYVLDLTPTSGKDTGQFITIDVDTRSGGNQVPITHIIPPSNDSSLGFSVIIETTGESYVSFYDALSNPTMTLSNGDSGTISGDFAIENNRIFENENQIDHIPFENTITGTGGTLYGALVGTTDLLTTFEKSLSKFRLVGTNSSQVQRSSQSYYIGVKEGGILITRGTSTDGSVSFDPTEYPLTVSNGNHNVNYNSNYDFTNSFKWLGGSTRKWQFDGDLQVGGDSGALAVGSTIIPSATNGRIDASNDVVAFSTSDERLKDNIIPLRNATSKIKQIGGYEFDWKELTDEEKKTIHGNEGHDIGVIAQEVEKVLPEIVHTRESGYKAVKYEKLVPLLIESIKELSIRIEELETKLSES